MPISTSPNFTVRVKDLGRLAEAEVELRPMTLFVGENNSGKSYLATLLWVVHRSGVGFWKDPEDPDWREAGKTIQSLVEEHSAQASHADRTSIGQMSDLQHRESISLVPSFSLDLSEDPRWANWALSIVGRRLPEQIRSAIGAAHICPEVVVENLTGGDRCRLTVGFGRLDGSGGSMVFNWETMHITISGNIEIAEPFLCEYALNYALLRRFPNFEEMDSAIGALYFPASRTGFIHNLPEMTERQLVRSFRGGDQARPSQMSAPVRQFFRFLVNPGNIQPQEDGLAALIEEQLVGGRFSVGPGIAYGYTPAGHNAPLAMNVTSSVVTELLPLWLLVATDHPAPPLLVYEEPEAHLHPRLQRIVALLLSRLVRRGTKVLVTTHSETFAQQINNLIKRSGLDPETRDATAGDFPYVADDYLSPDDVAGYEFRFRDDGRSYTERLDVRPDGIVMPMFNKELLALTDEAIRLDEALATKQAGR